MPLVYKEIIVLVVMLSINRFLNHFRLRKGSYYSQVFVFQELSYSVRERHHFWGIQVTNDVLSDDFDTKPPYLSDDSSRNWKTVLGYKIFMSSSLRYPESIE